jgi:hypothetical protein
MKLLRVPSSSTNLKCLQCVFWKDTHTNLVETRSMPLCFQSSTAPDGCHMRRNKHSTILTLPQSSHSWPSVNTLLFVSWLALGCWTPHDPLLPLLERRRKHQKLARKAKVSTNWSEPKYHNLPWNDFFSTNCDCFGTWCPKFSRKKIHTWEFLLANRRYKIPSVRWRVKMRYQLSPDVFFGCCKQYLSRYVFSLDHPWLRDGFSGLEA